MDVVFTARHYELGDHLRELIERKLGKLDDIVGDLTEARVILSEENYRHSVEVSLKARGHDFIASGEAADMNLAVDQTIDRVERQLRRYKDRLVSRRRSDQRASAEDTGFLTRHDRVASRPLSLEEAMQDVEDDGGEHLAFVNTETSQLNFLYRRQDGTFGLIEPTDGAG